MTEAQGKINNVLYELECKNYITFKQGLTNEIIYLVEQKVSNGIAGISIPINIITDNLLKQMK